MKTPLSLVTLLLLSFLFSNCNKESANNSSSLKTTKNDSLAFGDTKFLSDGLEGKMYFINPGTSAIPLFDTMQSVNTVYTDSINIPERSWSSGFPGLPNRFEWFGIEYNGNFKTIKNGHYTFRLVSDDGSKLFIDDSLVINNDGLHGVVSKTGGIDLNSAAHKIKIQYIQGPKFGIALQLFAHMDKEQEQIFPGKYFHLISSHSNYFFNKSTYIIGAVLLLVLILIIYRITARKRKAF